MKRNGFLVIIALMFCFSLFNINSTQAEELRKVPTVWLTFQPQTVPFVPLENTNYNKMFEKPININSYAGQGRTINKNYKPYHPNKRLYATSDYSYKEFLKETKINTKKCTNINERYNHWLWNKIRCDFKKVHGIYSATIKDNRGNKRTITWEDGGLVSIYEQNKLFFEHAKFKNTTAQKHYKYILNFRYNYPDTRVNNPYLEFSEPHLAEIYTNQLFVKLYTKNSSNYYPYDPSYQELKPTNGVIELTSEISQQAYFSLENNDDFIDSDGKTHSINSSEYTK